MGPEQIVGDYPRFSVTTEGRNEVDLLGVCETYVNNLWIPDGLTPDQAAEYATESFRRAVLGELEVLVVSPING